MDNNNKDHTLTHDVQELKLEMMALKAELKKEKELTTRIGLLLLELKKTVESALTTITKH
jgi:hypothetical protein|tara:strand:+ start:365 stop:544 length:180 start_codon:yes stop_codon:yes gene_type:complete